MTPFRDAYLQPFASFAGRAELEAAHAIALRLGWICRALNVRRFAVSLDPPDREEWVERVRLRLQMFQKGRGGQAGTVRSSEARCGRPTGAGLVVGVRRLVCQPACSSSRGRPDLEPRCLGADSWQRKSQPPDAGTPRARYGPLGARAAGGSSIEARRLTSGVAGTVTSPRTGRSRSKVMRRRTETNAAARTTLITPRARIVR